MVFKIFLLAVTITVSTSSSWGATVSITAYDRGYWDDSGWSDRAEGSVCSTTGACGTNDAGDYHVGITSFGEQRNYVLFDLSNYSGMEVVSASVKYYQNGSGKYWFGADDLTLYDISTSYDRLSDDGVVYGPQATYIGTTEGLNIYNDLGSGLVLGSTAVNNSYPSAQWINISLNSSGLANIQSQLGSLYGIGGACNSCVPNSTGQGYPDYLLGLSSQDGQAILTLELQAIPNVPIPSAVWLFGSGLIGLIGIARRKKPLL